MIKLSAEQAADSLAERFVALRRDAARFSPQAPLQKRAYHSPLLKEADWGKQLGDWWSNQLSPLQRKAMIGTGVGGALGLGSSLLSDKKERRPFRSALTGALAGGATGLGAGLISGDADELVERAVGKQQKQLSTGGASPDDKLLPPQPENTIWGTAKSMFKSPLAAIGAVEGGSPVVYEPTENEQAIANANNQARTWKDPQKITDKVEQEMEDLRHGRVEGDPIRNLLSKEMAGTAVAAGGVGAADLAQNVLRNRKAHQVANPDDLRAGINAALDKAKGKGTIAGKTPGEWEEILRNKTKFQRKLRSRDPLLEHYRLEGARHLNKGVDEPVRKIPVYEGAKRTGAWLARKTPGVKYTRLGSRGRGVGRTLPRGVAPTQHAGLTKLKNVAGKGVRGGAYLGIPLAVWMWLTHQGRQQDFDAYRKIFEENTE